MILTLKWSRYWALPLVVNLWTLTQKTHFPKEFFDQTRYLSKLLYNIIINERKTEKKLFGLEKRGETLIFLSRHFDETMIILISHFLRFGALKILTGNNFVLRINQTIYSKQKVGCFIHFSIFPSTFPTFPVSPIHFVQGGCGYNCISASKMIKETLINFN